MEIFTIIVYSATRGKSVSALCISGGEMLSVVCFSQVLVWVVPASWCKINQGLFRLAHFPHRFLVWDVLLSRGSERWARRRSRSELCHRRRSALSMATTIQSATLLFSLDRANDLGLGMAGRKC